MSNKCLNIMMTQKEQQNLCVFVCHTCSHVCMWSEFSTPSVYSTIIMQLQQNGNKPTMTDVSSLWKDHNAWAYLYSICRRPIRNKNFTCQFLLTKRSSNNYTHYAGWAISKYCVLLYYN